MSVKSPVTHSDSTSLVESIPSNEIIGLYKKEKIDVARFFQGLDSVKVYQCNDTGYRFFFPDTVFGDNEFYQDLYERIPGYYHVNRWEHQHAIGLIAPGARVLEVGCGDGFFLTQLRNKGAEAKGLELNSKAIAAAKQKGLDVESTTIQDYAKNHKEEYDVVCCFQVLEHIYDIHSFVDTMVQCLKPGGQLIIAVPNNNPHLFKRDNRHFLNLPPHHAGLWNAASLGKLSNFFPIELNSVLYEPLVELKMWYKAQQSYYKKEKPALGALLSIIPRQVYKPVLRMFRKNIQGKTIMVVFNKRK